MCVKRVVNCRFAEWGCEERFPEETREIHESKSCIVARRRARIAAEAAFVNEETVCDWCHQRVKKRHLLDHQEEECLNRERPCPNASNGCKEWVPVGQFDHHIRTVCSVTLERNDLAARARQKNTPVLCPECGETVKLRRLERHYRDECISRVVPCKNAGHGCRAQLRWRDRHLHEDFMALSRERSMLQFTTGGGGYIAVYKELSTPGSAIAGIDLAPPWTAEFFLWMVDAREEILSLLKRSLEHLETVVLNTRDLARWQEKSSACKKKLKELKQLRSSKRKDTAGDLSNAAKELADAFNDAESGIMATQQAISLARGRIQILVLEALRIYRHDIEADQKEVLQKEIKDQLNQVLEKNPILSEFVSDNQVAVLGDLELWAQQVNSGSQLSAPSNERQQQIAEQHKLLKKRADLQASLSELEPSGADSDRLKRRYDRELAKIEAKLALVSESTPTQLLERRGRHIIAASHANAISLVAGNNGEITIYRALGAKAAREVNFQVHLERNRWHHVVFCASKKELSLILNGTLKTVKRGFFYLPCRTIGAPGDHGESFQGFIQEIRYWKTCRTLKEIQMRANTILDVAICKQNENLLAYWTFEEGIGDLVDDMSLSIPRSPCFNTEWVLYNTAAVRRRFGIPPTPSLRDQTSCIINQRLKLLAQRAKDRDMDTALCRQHCGDTIAIRALDTHHRVECPNRIVVCSEFGCESTFRFVDRTKHLTEGCERSRYREQLVKSYYDKEVLDTCILNCGRVLKRRLFEQHYHEECPNRLTTCPREDCQETIVAKTIDSHLAKDCKSPSLARERQLVDKSRMRQASRQRSDSEGGKPSKFPSTR